jgi:TP901 family phage tail tape measure protein
MADLERTVKVAFLGEDKVTKTIDGITGRIDSFANRVGDATAPLASLTDNILKVEAALAALAIGGLALAFNEFSKFESASAELAKVLDLQTESLESAQKEAIELSSTYGQSSEIILQSFANFRQAGFDLAESMTLTKDALDLAIAGDMELAEASEIVVAALKGFGAEAGTAREIIDALNEVSNNFATNSQELGIGLATLSPIAKQMGLTFQETIGILTPIIEVFRSGSEAGNALKTVLLRLQADRSADTLKELGISQKDANDQFRAGKDILADVLRAFEGLNETEKAYYAQQLSGIFQAGKAVTVFDNLAKVVDVTQTAYDSFGSAAREVEIRLKTAEVQMDRFIVAVKNLGSAVGAELAPGFTAGLTAVNEFINAIREQVAAGAFDELFSAIDSISLRIADVFRAMAENLPDALEGIQWDDFIKSINNVVDGVVDLFKDFFGDIDLTSKEGLEKFIQRVVDSFTSLNNVVAGILDAFGPFVEKIGQLAEKFSDLDEDAAKAIGEILGWGKIINTVAGNITQLTGSLNFLIQALTWFTGVKMLAALKNMGQMGTAAGGLVGTLAKLQAAGLGLTIGWTLGTWLANNIPLVDKFGKGLADMALSIQGLGERQILAIEDQAAYNKALGDASAAAAQLIADLDGIPVEKQTDFGVKGSATYQAELDKMIEYVKSVPETKDTKLTASADEQSARDAYAIIRSLTTDPETGEEIWIETKVKIDQPSIDETQEALKEVPQEKIIIAKIENQTELEIARIKASAETIQSAMEWKARIDIAETEQLFETLRTQAQSIEAMFINTGEVLQTMVSGFEHLGPLGRSDLLQLMEKEIEIRAELARQQGELTAAEVKYLEARTEALKQGDALINIQVDGVYPELELIMHKLIEQTQVRATAEGLDFLIGS